MNFFTASKDPDPGSEHFETLYQNPYVTVERIASNALHDGQWYDQEHDEWVMLVRGNAVLEFDDAPKSHLKAGDCLLLPARQRHRVLSTSGDALWLALHLKTS